MSSGPTPVKYVSSDRCIKVEAHGTKVLIDTTGAQVVSFIPKKFEEQMYISAKCGSPPDMSIRAGNPVCFPQFATLGPLDKHGFLRMKPWTVQSNKGGKAILTIEIRNLENGGRIFNFVATFTATIVDDASLELSLKVINQDSNALNYTCAFHPYFAVGDIEQVRIIGAKGCKAFDKTGRRENPDFVENDPAIGFRNGLPVDTMYFCTSPDGLSQMTLDRGSNDPRGNLRAKYLSGFQDAVVWNVGEKDIREIKDMSDNDYMRYVCMEQAVLNWTDLPAGDSVTFATRYEVSRQ